MTNIIIPPGAPNVPLGADHLTAHQMLSQQATQVDALLSLAQYYWVWGAQTQPPTITEPNFIPALNGVDAPNAAGYSLSAGNTTFNASEPFPIPANSKIFIETSIQVAFGADVTYAQASANLFPSLTDGSGHSILGTNFGRAANFYGGATGTAQQQTLTASNMIGTLLTQPYPEALLQMVLAVTSGGTTTVQLRSVKSFILITPQVS